MTLTQTKMLDFFERLFEGETPLTLCNDELLNAKLSLDASFVHTGQESPDILEYIDNLNKLKLRYE